MGKLILCCIICLQLILISMHLVFSAQIPILKKMTNVLETLLETLEQAVII